MSRIVVLVTWFCLALTAQAQRTLEILNQDDITNWASSGDIDPRATVALGDGRLVYFEDDSGFNAGPEDGLVLVDPSQGWDSGGLTVIASETTLNSLGGSGSCCVYVSDLALDETGNLYAVVTDTNSGEESFIVRIPYTNNSFGTPERFSDFFDGGVSSDRTLHRLAVNGGLVFAAFDDNADGNQNGVYTQDDAGTNGTTADFSLIASISDLAQHAFGASNETYRITTMVSDHIGGVMMVFHEMDGNDEVRGTILRLTANGSISTVLSSADATDRTGVQDAFDGFTCLSADRSTGDFYTFETGGDGNSEQIWQFGSDGSFKGQVGGYWQMRDAGSAESDTMFSGYSNSFSFGGDHIYFWNNHNSAGKETLFKVDLLDTCPPSLSWPHGEATNDDVSCHFGPRQLFSGGFRHDFHRGIDMAMPIGTPLFGTGHGIVDQADYDAIDDEYKLRIRHYTNGCAPTIYSWYNHCSELLVGEGDEVFETTTVAKSGVDGNYEHLHFGVRQYNGGPDYAVNPLAYLNYDDNDPITPISLGSSDDLNQSLAFIEIQANDEELDVAGLVIEQGTDRVDWDYAAVNRANAPFASEKLDTPITVLENGLVLGVFPEWMRADIDTSVIRIAIAGLASSGSTPTVSLKDVKGTESPLQLPAADSDIRPNTVFASQTVNPNTTVDVDIDLTNDSGQVMSLDFEAFSAMKHDLSFPNGSNQVFQIGQTKTITVRVEFGSDSAENGDAILLIGNHNGTNKVTVLRQLTR